MTEPNKDRLRLWVSALRSGEFHQAREQLRDYLNGVVTPDDDSNIVARCCLDVANEVAFRNGVENDVKFGTYTSNGEAYLATTRMTVNAKDWYGLPDVNPDLRGQTMRDVFRTLGAVSWNDDIKKDFDGIADMIEETFDL